MQNLNLPSTMGSRPLSISLNSLRKLRRNRQRRRLGGVCAGLADFLGVDVTLIRLVFVLSVFFSFSATLWVYLALWILVPAKSDTPLPDVSWRLGRELRKIEKQVRKAHRRLHPAIADQAQEIFEAIKILAPYFETAANSPARTAALAEAALRRFPSVLKQLLALPDGFVSFRDAESLRTAAGTPAAVLLDELHALKTALQGASSETIDWEIRKNFGDRQATSPEIEAWKERLHPLRERLNERASPATLATLRGIEEKLVFLLDRIKDNGAFDLKPFEVRKIAFDYLPDAVEQYLRLPPAMARSEPLAGGKTAEESLNEQLLLLDRTLQDTAKSLFENDAHGLVVHGRFLREKFADQSFRLSE
jgi:phage shock protein PspC (stress-responsive transcriptional regulator)